MNVENETEKSEESSTETETTTTTTTEAPEKTETTETKTEEKVEEKTEEKTEEAKVEPLTVEKLSAPEGFEITPEAAAPFLEILNGEMSVEDRANALIALHTKAISDASEASSKLWDDTQEEWKNEAKADPEIGGDKLPATLSNIGKLLDEFGTKELAEVFGLTGAGNNVHVVKFLNTIANKLTEGNFFTSGSPASDGNDPNAAAKRMFPSMKG